MRTHFFFPGACDEEYATFGWHMSHMSDYPFWKTHSAASSLPSRPSQNLQTLHPSPPPILHPNHSAQQHDPCLHVCIPSQTASTKFSDLVFLADPTISGTFWSTPQHRARRCCFPLVLQFQIKEKLAHKVAKPFVAAGKAHIGPYDQKHDDNQSQDGASDYDLETGAESTKER